MAQAEAPSSVDFGNHRVQFVHSLRTNGQRESSQKIAQATVGFIRKIIAQERYENIRELLSVLREHLRFSVRLCPSELVIRNIFLIAMKLAREENSRAIYGVDKDLGNPYDSLSTLWRKDDTGDIDESAGKKLRKGLIAAVKEIVSELETTRQGLLERVSDVFQINDTVLIYGLNSSSSLQMFVNAGRKVVRMRQLISICPGIEDAECPDYVTSHGLRDVAHVMQDVTKVILPCAAVFPDGSCLVQSGALSIALVAHRHAVPVHVVAAFYKVAPYFSADAAAAVSAQGPVGLPVRMAHELRDRVILSPIFDVVPAQLVTLYISNSGAVLPSHVYRLITDYYHPEDLTEEI